MNVLQDIEKLISFNVKMRMSVPSMVLINVIPTRLAPTRKVLIYAHAILVIVEMESNAHVSFKYQLFYFKL